jgi:hypothetical protein
MSNEESVDQPTKHEVRSSHRTLFPVYFAVYIQVKIVTRLAYDSSGPH